MGVVGLAILRTIGQASDDAIENRSLVMDSSVEEAVRVFRLSALLLG